MNRTIGIVGLLLMLELGCAFRTPAQTEMPTSVDAKLVLDAAGAEQRQALKAIYLIVCPGVGTAGGDAGTGFLLESGIVVTNSHVIADCTEQNLYSISSANKTVKFSKIINDRVRDLALLVPSEKLQDGLKLSATDSPAPGKLVSTWGYPFLYNNTSPLLSIGFVSGFRNAPSNTGEGKPTKHIVVNGTFNHGNSGGPLFLADRNDVIGVVVLTFHFYPPYVRNIIDNLSNLRSGLVLRGTNSDGTFVQASESQLTAAVLDEFYQKTQVMIGEAIAASEVRAVIKEHASELSKQ